MPSMGLTDWSGRMTEQARIPLLKLHELKDPDSRGFTLTTGQGTLEVLVVHKGGEVYGYVNRCPHTGVNLDWMPDQFLDPSNGFIQCATHGALFRIDDGVCLRGPCAGDRLRPITLQIEGEEVFVIPG